jgi:D-alanine-D-alanine ligase
LKLKRTIGVLTGGWEVEKEYSERAGNLVLQSLLKQGISAVNISVNSELTEVIKKIKLEKVDLVYNLVYGSPGQDGTLQGVLDLMKIPYTGSGVTATAIARDKALTKTIWKSINIPTPHYITINNQQWENNYNNLGNILGNFRFPIVIKPNLNSGLSYGVCVATTIEDAKSIIPKILELDSIIIIEEFINGTELWLGIEGSNPPFVFPPIQFDKQETFFTFEEKVKGSKNRIIPPQLSREVLEQAKNLALKTYSILGCKGLCYFECVIDKNQIPYFLEIGTVAGLTDISHFPYSAHYLGVSYDELILRPLLSAIDDFGLDWTINDFMSEGKENERIISVD